MKLHRSTKYCLNQKWQLKICKLARSWIKNLSTRMSGHVLEGWSSDIAENILLRAGGPSSVHKKLSKHDPNGDL